MKKEAYFLPYQVSWLKDQSLIKLWEKSRRIGASYGQSYEDVDDCVKGKVPGVWFSSADESAGKEYIRYCEMWAKLMNAGAKLLGDVILDEKKGIKGTVIEFKNGRRITALSSNPKAFRSKGGKVVLDEFAWHDDPDTLWAAARPCITWGFPLRIISTHNGTGSRFNRFVEDIKKGALKWSLHTDPIHKAVEEGLVDKIRGHKTTEAERAEWLAEARASCNDEETWLQEFCCIPVDSASSFLTYDIIRACESADSLVEDLSGLSGDLYLGYDVARKKDLSVIELVEKYGGMVWTRKQIVMEKTKFSTQKEILWKLLALPRLRRACIDCTGLGMQMAEEAQDAFGKFKVEGVNFSGPVKEELAYGLRNYFDDKAIRVPEDFAMREDLHSVKKTTTAAGNIRFDVAASERAGGHADRFWSLALAIHAISKADGPIRAASAAGSSGSRILKGYEKAENGLFLMRSDQRNRKSSGFIGF
jgi:phage FluMu gp28-like protein